MDYLQYIIRKTTSNTGKIKGFKPCYKWITFNTKKQSEETKELISFKPCYKWITFNTFHSFSFQL